MQFQHGETVTRLRGTPTAGDYNAGGTDWSAPDELPIEGVAFDPGPSAEPIVTGHTMRVVTQPTIYDPSYADVLPGDRIRRELTGRVYDVEGEPAAYKHPMTGWAPGQVIALKAVSG